MNENLSASIRNLEACRDTLLFTLTDEAALPEDIAKALWETCDSLVPRIEQLKARHSVA